MKRGIELIQEEGLVRTRSGLFVRAFEPAAARARGRGRALGELLYRPNGEVLRPVAGGAAATGIYLPTMIDVFDATQLALDLTSNLHKVALVTNSYTPNFSTHDQFADVTNEVSGTGYTAGGTVIAGASFAEGSAGSTKFDINDTSWATATITARAAIMYADNLTGDPLIGSWDFGSDVVSTAGTFLITWNASGLMVIDWTP